MNLIMISKVHQWNKTYFNRQSNDLQSLVELCVAQPSRSQVTGRKEPWERGCVLISSCLLYQNPSSSRSDYQNRGSPIFSITGMITDRIGRYESNFCYNFIIIITIFEKKKHLCFFERAFNINYPKLGKISKRHCVMLQIRPFLLWLLW